MRTEAAIGKGYKLVVKDILLTIRALLVTAMWFVIVQCILTIGITAHLHGKDYLNVVKYLSKYLFQSDMHLVDDALSYLFDETVRIFFIHRRHGYCFRWSYICMAGSSKDMLKPSMYAAQRLFLKKSLPG